MRVVELLSKKKDETKQKTAINTAVYNAGHQNNAIVVIESVDDVCDDDVVFIHDYSCLGTNIKDFIVSFNVLREKKVEVHFVKEGMSFYNETQMNVFMTSLTFAEKFDRQLRSAVSLDNLADAAKRGKYAGRPKGSKNKDSLILSRGDEIEFWLQQGETKKFIAEQLGISVGTVYNYIKSKTEA